MALEKLGDATSAEDATHDVFVNFWQKAASFKPGRGKFCSWLLTVAHDQIVDTLRRRRKSRDIQEAASRDPTLSKFQEGTTRRHWSLPPKSGVRSAER